MTPAYGADAAAYGAFKSMLFAPGTPQAIESLIEVLEARGGEVELVASARAALAAPEQLEFEFNRMCIGPYRLSVPPYESVWRSGAREIWNRFTTEVALHYERIGLVIDDSLREPADFIGNELEFLYCVRALQVQHAEDPEALSELCAIHDDFLRAHLSQWYGDFCAALVADARLPFWRLYGEALARFLDEQTQALPEPAPAPAAAGEVNH